MPLAIPIWLLTHEGEIFRVANIRTIQVVSSSLVITFVNGRTRNYQFSTTAVASSWYATYRSLLSPTEV